jgi:hypothetical protein
MRISVYLDYFERSEIDCYEVCIVGEDGHALQAKSLADGGKCLNPCKVCEDDDYEIYDRYDGDCDRNCNSSSGWVADGVKRDEEGSKYKKDENA